MNKLSFKTVCPRFFKAIALALALCMGGSPLAAVAGQIQNKPQPTPTSTPADTSNEYPKMLISPGDILVIYVYGENGVIGSGGSEGMAAELPTNYQVDSDGNVLFPFLGKVALLGLSPIAAGEKLASMLGKPRKVTVLVQQSSTYWVSVLGNVAHPGKFQIQGRPTLLAALSDAGGPLPDTDLGGTILIHDQVKSKLDLGKYLQDTGTQMKDPYLYPGDVLMVPKSGWPSVEEWAIIASILASGAVIVTNLHR